MKNTDTLSFDINIPDSTQQHTANLIVRYNLSYLYDSLFLNVGTRDSLHFSIQPLTLRMVDEYGNLYMPDWGEVAQISVPLEIDFSGILPKSEIIVCHRMKDSLLKGITEIGIEILKANPDESRE